MDLSLHPEVLLHRADGDAAEDSDAHRQRELGLASAGVQRWVWQGRYGAMLIEVIGAEVYVNGARVERHVP